MSAFARVQRGAAVLDEIALPGWRDRLDLDRLDASSGDDDGDWPACPLGMLDALGEFSEGAVRIKEAAVRLGLLAEDDDSWDLDDFGFYASETDREAVNAAWRRHVRRYAAASRPPAVEGEPEFGWNGWKVDVVVP